MSRQTAVVVFQSSTFCFFSQKEGGPRVNTKNIDNMNLCIGSMDLVAVLPTPVKLYMRAKGIAESGMPEVGSDLYREYYKLGRDRLSSWLGESCSRQNQKNQDYLHVGKPALYSIDDTESYRSFAYAYKKRPLKIKPRFWAVMPGISANISKEDLIVVLSKKLGVQTVVNLRSYKQIELLRNKSGGVFAVGSYKKEMGRVDRLSDRLPGVRIGFSAVRGDAIAAMLNKPDFEEGETGFIANQKSVSSFHQEQMLQDEQNDFANEGVA